MKWHKSINADEPITLADLAQEIDEARKLCKCGPMVNIAVTLHCILDGDAE